MKATVAFYEYSTKIQEFETGEHPDQLLPCEEELLLGRLYVNRYVNGHGQYENHLFIETEHDNLLIRSLLTARAEQALLELDEEPDIDYIYHEPD